MRAHTRAALWSRRLVLHLVAEAFVLLVGAGPGFWLLALVEAGPGQAGRRDFSASKGVACRPACLGAATAPCAPRLAQEPLHAKTQQKQQGVAAILGLPGQ